MTQKKWCEMTNHEPCEKCKPIFEEFDTQTAKLLRNILFSWVTIVILTALVFYDLGAK